MHPTHQPLDRREITPADVLRGAALYLRRHGWHQGTMYVSFVNPTPAACLLGAIRMAACGGTQVTYTDATAVLAEQAVYELAAFLRRCTFSGDLVNDDEVVSTWNDHPTTTKLGATRVLDAAADQWDTTHSDTPTRHPGGAA